MQKLIMVPSSCCNLREHWLITIQIGPNDEGTPKASQPFHFIAQCSGAGHNWMKEALSVFYVYLLALGSQSRDALNWGQEGAEPIAVWRLHRRLRKTQLELPPAHLNQQLRQGGGAGAEQTACALFHVSNWIFSRQGRVWKWRQLAAAHQR